MVKEVNKSTRYERKFFISFMNPYEVRDILSSNPAFFSEIYHTRFVNNIYFDSMNKKNYFDNIDGVPNRVKYRIRWYGELFGAIENPILEVKGKKGLLGYKEKFALKPFTLDSSFCRNTVINLIKNASDLPADVVEAILCLSPTLLNRYKRKYFQSAFGDFRATIDSEMKFFTLNDSFNSFLTSSTDDVNTILELKYPPKKDKDASKITRSFPFRLTKSSKYTTGVETLARLRFEKEES